MWCVGIQLSRAFCSARYYGSCPSWASQSTYQLTSSWHLQRSCWSPAGRGSTGASPRWGRCRSRWSTGSSTWRTSRGLQQGLVRPTSRLPAEEPLGQLQSGRQVCRAGGRRWEPPAGRGPPGPWSQPPSGQPLLLLPSLQHPQPRRPTPATTHWGAGSCPRGPTSPPGESQSGEHLSPLSLISKQFSLL